MSHELSRRAFLRSAGGITFLALTPIGRGLFAAPGHASSALPIFTALPYVQPGPAGKLTDGQEAVVIAWQTERKPADFEITYGQGKPTGQSARVQTAQRWSGDASEGEGRVNYSATLTGLALGRRYDYRVRCNGRTIAEGYFSTRKPRGQKTRFVAFGDNSYGEISDRAIAYYAYQQHPDFVMNTGDNVYESGLDNEYARYFFPVYNADVAEVRTGAPLLRSVPYYTVIANHDVHGRDANHHPVADFDKDRDALAYYTNMYLPLNGPTPPQPTPIAGAAERLGGFREAAGPRFPQMANYAFDYGDAHFLCLDSNVYVDPTDSALQTWIESDLAGTDAPWKFVVYHHPAFNVGLEHYKEQHMRVLSPLFEKHGVQFVLHGHEHTYQRTRPLRFAPGDATKAALVGASDRRVPGTFTVDTQFDGATNTKPDGVLYITTGAGGKHLYEPGFTDDPSKWLHPDDNNVAYVARFVSDTHSLTVFDMDANEITMRQISETGDELDKIRVTRA